MRLRVVLVLVVALAGCGDDGRSPGTPATKAEGGEVTYCVDETSEATERTAVNRFNRANESRRYSARLRVTTVDDDVLPSTCDVGLVHAFSMGDLAADGDLADLTDRVEAREEDFVPATLDLVRYDDRLWGLPKFVDVGFLYYKTDTGTPPFTWQEAYALGRTQGGLVYAGSAGPSLALHFLEVATAAGGRVLSDDGAASELDSPQNLRALEFMRRGITSGAVPSAVTRMDEEQSRSAFDRGAGLMRNWTYAYGASKVDDFDRVENADIIELPAFGDGEPTALLTGEAVVVAADSADEPVAHALADYVTGPEEAKRVVERFNVPTALTASYDAGTTVLDHLPYSLELERTLERAVAQPVVPDWVWIQEAIAKRVNAALAGRMSPRAALMAAHRDVEGILSGAVQGERSSSAPSAAEAELASTSRSTVAPRRGSRSPVGGA